MRSRHWIRTRSPALVILDDLRHPDAAQVRAKLADAGHSIDSERTAAPLQR
jgi:hypothetical protein